MMMLLALLLTLMPTDARADCTVAAGEGTPVTLDVQLFRLADGALAPGGEGALALYRVRGGVYESLGDCAITDGAARLQLSYQEGGAAESLSVEVQTGEVRLARRYYLAEAPLVVRGLGDLYLLPGSDTVSVAFAAPGDPGVDLAASCSTAEAAVSSAVERHHGAAVAGLAMSHEVLWGAVASLGELRADDELAGAIASVPPAAEPLREASGHLDIDPDNTHITDALIAYGAARTLLSITLEDVEEAARRARKRKVPSTLGAAMAEVQAALGGVDLALEDAGDALELVKAARDPALSLAHLPEDPTLAAALTTRAATCRVSVTHGR